MTYPAETSKIRCKVCGKDKLRILDGRYDAVNKRWKDEKGGHFNGKVCPDCHRNNVKAAIKVRRRTNG